MSSEKKLFPPLRKKQKYSNFNKIENVKNGLKGENSYDKRREENINK